MQPKLILKSLVFSLIFSLFVGASPVSAEVPYQQPDEHSQTSAAKGCALLVVGIAVWIAGAYIAEKISGPAKPSIPPASISTPSVPGDDGITGPSYD